MSTFINQILQPHFPSQDVAIGWIGFVIVVAGTFCAVRVVQRMRALMTGRVVCVCPGILGDVAIGVYLDKTHRYKAGFLGCNGGAIVWYVHGLRCCYEKCAVIMTSWCLRVVDCWYGDVVFVLFGPIRFALFIVAVHLEMLWLVFIAAGMVGLCGTSVLVLGLEFAAQVRLLSGGVQPR